MSDNLVFVVIVVMEGGRVARWMVAGLKTLHIAQPNTTRITFEIRKLGLPLLPR